MNTTASPRVTVKIVMVPSHAVPAIQDTHLSKANLVQVQSSLRLTSEYFPPKMEDFIGTGV